MPKKVYIKDKNLIGHSRHHTIYVGDPNSGKNPSGFPTRLIKQEFHNGQAMNVDETAYRIMHDLGHVDTAKPSLDEE